MTNFYIYRHVRPDTNEVFYIGKGNNLDGRRYARAKTSIGRNAFWNRIVKKNDGNYKVEILYDCDTMEEANKKEIEFIALYGRVDLKMGTLCNHTDGGEGATNPSAEVRQRMSEKHKGVNSHFAMKVIDTQSGIIYDCVDDAAIKNNMPKWGLYKMLKGGRPNKTTMIYLENYNENNYAHLIKQPPIITPKPDWKKVIDRATGKIYDCMMDAANEFQIGKTDLLRMLRGYYYSRGKKYLKTNTTTLEYYGVSV